MSDPLKPYPSPVRIDKGKEASQTILGFVSVTEKIDGSQGQMSRQNGSVKFSSKRQALSFTQPNANFSPWMAACRDLDLREGWTYFCEVVTKPKHNKLTYANTPNRYCVVFDIQNEAGEWLDWFEVDAECERLGLVHTPHLYAGALAYPLPKETIEGWMAKESILGGTSIEGVVIKKYAGDTVLRQVKVVREDFQELGRKRSPEEKDHDLLTACVNAASVFCSQARWEKAVQALKEDGKLTASGKDIPLIIRAVMDDIMVEEADTLANMVFALVFERYGKQMRNEFIKGLPQWYLARLEVEESNAD